MIDQHNSLAEKFLKKGFWLYLFSFIIAPMGYIIKIIISGELTVSEVGILYGIISLITLISAYNDFGLTDSMNYFIPKFITECRYDKVKTILFISLLFQVTTGIIISLIFFFGADYISNNYFNSSSATDILKVFAFFFLGINIFQIISTFFLVIQNTLLNKLIELIRMIFVLLSIILIYTNDIGSLVNYSYSWIVGLYIGVFSSIIFFIKKYYNKYLKKQKIVFDKKLFKEIFQYSITIYIGIQAGTLLSQIDMQMIIFLLGTESAGYYTNYLSIIGIPFILIGPIFGFLYPVFSEIHSKGDNKKIKLIKETFQKHFLGFAISFNILFFIFAEMIAFILFGEKFIESGIILKYSILFLGFNFLLQLNFNIMGGIGKVKERVKIITIALIFNTVMNFILIKYIGVYGAAIATGLGWSLIWILSEIELGKNYITKFDIKYLIKNLIILLTTLIVIKTVLNDMIISLSRLESLFFLSILSLIYFGIFTLINYSDFINAILRIKKIKK